MTETATDKPTDMRNAELARLANAAAEELKAKSTPPGPNVPTTSIPVDTTKPCCVCSKPAVHFTGAGKGLDPSGKPIDETTGNYCHDHFQELLSDWTPPLDFIPKIETGDISQLPMSMDVLHVVTALNNLTRAVNEGFRGLVVALERIEKRTGA